MKVALILFFYILGVFFLLYYSFFTPPQQEQFVALTHSFLQEKLYFTSAFHDIANYAGKAYWPLGPFPSVLLMPFVYLFGGNMKQGYLLFFLNIINIFLLFRIFKQLSGNLTNSLIISFAILFSTAYLGIALVNWSWYFAQTVGFTLILLALEAYFFNRSWSLVGIYIGLAYATRISLIFTSVFFVLNLFYSDLSNKAKLNKAAMLIIPIIASVIIIGLYNYERFGNPAETGYSMQQWSGGPAVANRTLGLWSLIHIPRNLYSMFLKMPAPVFIPGTEVLQFPYLQADGSGISILFTSPVFIWILFSNWRNKKVKFAAVTALITIFALSGSFSNGGWQYGQRYAIDFYPMLAVILLYSFKSDVSYKFLAVAIIGFLVNLYFINTIFYPGTPFLNFLK